MAGVDLCLLAGPAGRGVGLAGATHTNTHIQINYIIIITCKACKACKACTTLLAFVEEAIPSIPAFFLLQSIPNARAGACTWIE